MGSSQRGRRAVSVGVRTRAGFSLLAVCAVVATSFGCGGGGAGSGVIGTTAGTASLSIATKTLPAAGKDSSYEMSLAAEGGTAPYAWSLDVGPALPPGLSLSGAGLLYGAPTKLGRYIFGVRVSDASAPTALATTTFTFEVTAFRANVEELHFGAAWTGEPYTVRASGTTSASFSLVENDSGATLTTGSPLETIATYVAGPNAGTDTIAVRGGSGATVLLHVLVVENPVASLSARFGSTDVWFVQFTGKLDPTHPFDSDWHAALATVGLRDPSSTEETGSTADEIADLYVRRQALRYLNILYGNPADGTPDPSGLAISFPFERPDIPYVAPPKGVSTPPAGNRYNVMSVIAGTNPEHFGTAIQDSPFNTTQENDTTREPGAAEFGVFVNQIATFFVLTYRDEILTASPVGDADVSPLLDLLYDHHVATTRAAELKRILDGFARSVAALAAHEIGHSLGLAHTSPAVEGSIMNAYARIDPAATYFFVASDRTLLSRALPGPGRSLTTLPPLVNTLLASPEESAEPAVVPPDCSLVAPAR